MLFQNILLKYYVISHKFLHSFFFQNTSLLDNQAQLSIISHNHMSSTQRTPCFDLQNLNSQFDCESVSLSLSIYRVSCAQTTVIIISVCVFVSDLIAHASFATSSKMFAVSYVEKCRAEKAHLGEQECIPARD